MARSSYYHWRVRQKRELERAKPASRGPLPLAVGASSPSERERKNAELLEKIEAVFEKNRGRYGNPRVHLNGQSPPPSGLVR